MPGWSQIPKDKPERHFVFVQNDEASASMAAGSLAVFNMDGTDNGVDVVRPPSSTAAKASGFFAGVVTKALSAGDRGLAQCYGLVNALTVTQQTRAASTDSYATAAAVAIGDWLAIETIGGNATRSGAGSQTIALPFLVAIGTLASKASSASSDITADTSTAKTSSITAFVRAM